jgi:hypothetical protein
MLLIIILFVLLFGFGGGYWGHRNYGQQYEWAGPGFGIGTILIVLLVCYLLGLFR